MFFRMIYDDRLAQAAYLIGCQRTGEAVIINPERDVDRYIALAVQEGLRLVAVAETHIHADFLAGTRELAATHGARVYLSDCGDDDWKYHWPEETPGIDCVRLRDGDSFHIGKIELKAMHTPGHTPEHLSFLLFDHGSGATDPMGMLSGDFVFVGDMGRPDLLETAVGQSGAKESSARLLHASAQRFLTLPEFLQVWPAHGAGSACGKALGAVPQSTVGYEKRFNPALILANDGQQFVDYVLEGQPEPPLYFARMKTWNRDGAPVLTHLPEPKELDSHALDGLLLDDSNVRPTMLDTRAWSQFRQGHIRGSLYIPLTMTFCATAGSFIMEDERIVLVTSEAHLDECVRALVRIGLDHIDAWVSPETMAACMGRPNFAEKIDTVVDVSLDDVEELVASNDVYLLDVRKATEFAGGHLVGAHNLAHTRLLTRLNEIPTDQRILAYCQSGIRSAATVSLLLRHGIEAMNMPGGIQAWEAHGKNVVIGEAVMGHP